MMIIIAAENEIDLEDIAQKYDGAKNPSERERIAETVYEQIGSQIKPMIRRIGPRLSAADIDGFAHEAIVEALENSGVTKIQRKNGIWETLIQRFKNGNPVAKKIFELLLPATRKAIEAPYLKSVTADQFVRELNVMLRRPDFYDEATWSGVSLPAEAKVLLTKGLSNITTSEMSRFNALVLCAACPEISIPNEPPPRSILGFISKFWLPSNRARIAEVSGAPPLSEYVIEAKNALHSTIQKLRQMESDGSMPLELSRLEQAQRVYVLHRQLQQQRYGPTIKWWEEQIRKLQPVKPFRINDPASLRDAKVLFSRNPDRVNPHLWKEKSAPYFMPVSALEPFGASIIQRVLDLEVGTRPLQPSVDRAAPAVQSSGETQIATLLHSGHQSPAYRYLVDRLFSRAQAEYWIGMFLADHDSPSEAEIDRFISTLPDGFANDVEASGWNRTVYLIDSKILNVIKDTQFRLEVQNALEMEPNQIMAAVEFIRRHIFCRTTHHLLSRRSA